MKKAILSSLMMLAVLFSAWAIDKKETVVTNKAGKTFVLVHGAWMAPYAWDKVAAELTKSGAKVIVVQLPGHGSDKTNPAQLTLDVYKNVVLDAVNKASGKVILVGHSLAGMVISEVAEAVPAKIEKLVYVGAYLPANGQSLLDLANTDAKALLGPNLVPSADKLTLDVKHENIINIFCADAADATKALVLKKFRVEPAIPFTNPAKLSAANFGAVNKAYVHTLQDHVISPDLQDRMVSTAGIKEIYSLESSHTPFLSMPDKLTALLIKISKS